MLGPPRAPILRQIADANLLPQNICAFGKEEVGHDKRMIEESHSLIAVGLRHDPFDGDAGIDDDALAGKESHRSSRPSRCKSSERALCGLSIMARTCAARSLKDCGDTLPSA